MNDENKKQSYVKEIKLTKEQTKNAIKRATKNAKYWAQWKDPLYVKDNTIMNKYVTLRKFKPIIDSEILHDLIEEFLNNKKYILDRYEARTQEENGPYINIVNDEHGFEWEISDGKNYYMKSLRVFDNAEKALDDLLKSDQQWVIDVVNEIFPK